MDEGGIQYYEQLDQQEQIMTEIKGLALLREPFPSHQISKLPKPTKVQTDCPPEQKRKCVVCGGFHHPQVIHLDYVGHAALTNRLLDCDPAWFWEPLAYKEGLPAFDATGGLWIKLTVCGQMRLGYGHAASAAFKEIGSREKEVIGDALRNAAMRFGAALDLWHKGDLHENETPPAPKSAKSVTQDVKDNLLPDRQEVLYRMAADIIAVFDEDDERGFQAYTDVKTTLDADEQVALWHFFNSKQRARIKTIGGKLQEKTNGTN